MPVSFTQVDAFTSEPFRGNPAAVCLLPEPRADDWLQAVAREMNLAETAFLRPADEGYELRWFTPTVEVDLCGHATLASAHVLWESGRLAPSEAARFHTRGCLLTARCEGGSIELDFPATPAVPVEAPPGLDEGLGVKPTQVAKSQFDYLAELESEQEVRELQPNFHVLRSLPSRGVIVTAQAGGGYDFVSRFFAPQSGVDEDPVTGSAHCCLGPYWQAKLGREEFRAYQASARGGEVGVRVAGERVYLLGKAVTVIRGEIL